MKIARVTVAVASVAAVALTAACGSATSSGGGDNSSLAIGLDVSVASLNPTLTPQSVTVVYAYDPLIFRTASGTYIPDLASSWKYVGTGRKQFQLTIRKGAKFSDGTAVTAQAVVNSLEYFLKTPNPNIPAAGPISGVKTVGSNVVEIDYSSSFPDAVDSLTQFWGIGLIIGPKGLKNPASLTTTTDGAGPYELDAAKTVANSVYTFTARSDYWKPSAVHYKTIQLKPLPDANARLSALKSGQIQDASQVSLAQVGASAANGYQKLSGESTWEFLYFLNRSTGPTSKLGVRQALQYGVDRAAIVKDLYRGYATSQDQFSPAGTLGYSSALAKKYTYDPARAKQLLAAAGYPKGFTLHLLTNAVADPGGLLAAALKDQLSKIGVTVDITNSTGTFAQFTAALKSKSEDAVLWNLFSTDLYAAATQSLLGPMSLLNPSGTQDAGANTLLSQLASSPTDAGVAAKSQALNAYLTDNAFGVPIATRVNIDLISPSVKLPSTTYKALQAMPVSPDAASGWSSS